MPRSRDPYRMTLEDVLEAQSMVVAMGRDEPDDHHYDVIWADGSTTTMYRDRFGNFLADGADFQPGPAIFSSVSMNFGRSLRKYVSPAVALAYEGLRWDGDPNHYMHLYPHRSAQNVRAAA